MSKLSASFFLIILIFSFNRLSTQNNYLDFDGLDDYINFGNVHNFGTSDFTIEAWVYLDALPSLSKIINKGQTQVGTPSNAGYSIRAENNLLSDDIEFRVGNSDGSFSVAKAPVATLDNWFHVAGVRSGTTITLYFNGLVVATTDTGTTFDVDTNVEFGLGALYRGSLGATREFLNGKLDEVRLWDKARTQAEIQSTLNQELAGSEPGLIAYYNFNQGIPGGNNPTETILFDQTSNGNNGDLAFFSLTGDNSNWLGSAAPLPVELISFNGKRSGLQVILSWQTSHEDSNRGFWIDRLTQSGLWETIGFVPANEINSTTNNYQLVDKNPKAGTIYYRLRQEDYDAIIVALATISVNYGIDSAVFQLYPNPASERVFVSEIEQGEYMIVDITGLDVQQGIVSLSGIALTNLTPGLYFVVITSDHHSVIRKLYIR